MSYPLLNGTIFYNGEHLSFWVSIVQLPILLCFLPFLAFRIIYVKAELLRTDYVINKWSYLYTDVFTNRRWQRAYVMVYLVRRIILSLTFVFITIGFFQVVLVMVVNIIVIGYNLLLSPLKTQALNRLEIFNESMILVILSCLIAVSNPAYSKDAIYDFGYAIVVFVLLFMSFDIIFHFYHIFKGSWLNYTKKFNRHTVKKAEDIIYQ